jgi:hypothetical protein
MREDQRERERGREREREALQKSPNRGALEKGPDVPWRRAQNKYIYI